MTFNQFRALVTLIRHPEYYKARIEAAQQLMDEENFSYFIAHQHEIDD